MKKEEARSGGGKTKKQARSATYSTSKEGDSDKKDQKIPNLLKNRPLAIKFY